MCVCLYSVGSFTLGSTNLLSLVPWVEPRVEPRVGPGEEEGVEPGAEAGVEPAEEAGGRHARSLSRRNLRQGDTNSFEFCLKFLRRWHCFHIILNEKEKETNY